MNVDEMMMHKIHPRLTTTVLPLPCTDCLNMT